MVCMGVTARRTIERYRRGSLLTGDLRPTAERDQRARDHEQHRGARDQRACGAKTG